MRTNTSAVMTIVAIASATAGFGDEAYLMGLGDLPGGLTESLANAVSADGSTVVGVSSSDAGWAEAFRWTVTTGMVGLGSLGQPVNSEAYGVSPDGRTVVGGWQVPWAGHAWESFRWSAGDGMVRLIPIGEYGFIHRGYDVSDTGLVVGYSSYRPAMWGIDALPIQLPLPPDHDRGSARAITPDGRWIVGTTRGPGDSRAWHVVMWGADGGAQIIAEGRARDITPDGRVVVGTDGQSWYWTAKGGKIPLGWVCDPAETSSPRGVSDAGSVIVGVSHFETVGTPFIWDAENGIRALREVLVDEYGLDLSGWSLDEVNGISGDGRTIVGTGIREGRREAWLAYTP